MATPAETFKTISDVTAPMQKMIETLLSKDPADQAKKEQLTQNIDALKKLNEIEGPAIVDRFTTANNSTGLSR